MKQYRALTKKEIKYISASGNVGLAGSLAPTWVLGGVISTGIGLYYESMNVFWGVQAFFIILPFIIKSKSTSKKVKVINKSFLNLQKQIEKSLKNIDYIHIGAYGAIGVDAANKEISVISIDKSLKLNHANTFQPEKIRDYRISAPGYTQHEHVDHAGGATFQERESIQDQNTQNKVANFRRNEQLRNDAQFETGLYFNLDDIKKPQVFAQMEFIDAEKWMLIIEKLKNNTLETQSPAMLYPPVPA